MDLVFTYFLIRIFLFIILIFAGYLLSQNRIKKSFDYWVISILPIIIYSLIEGLRYDRGIDYMHYKQLYENALNIESYWDVEAIEPFFQLINKSIRLLGLPYPYIFILYSFIFISAGFIFVKKHRKVAVFAIPFYFMATSVQSENLVRQFVAFSFLLISLDYFISSSWLKFSIYFTIAVFTHNSSIIFLPILFIFKYFKNPFGNLYVILGLYSLSWLWKPEYLGNFEQYLDLLQVSETKYQGYIENANTWLLGDNLMEFEITTFSLVRLFIFNTGIIILGYKLIEKYRNNYYPFFYYIFVFGAIFQNITTEIELLYRIDLYFYMFWFIVLAYITYDTFILHTKNMYSQSICVFLILNIFYDFISPIFKLNASEVLFIWN